MSLLGSSSAHAACKFFRFWETREAIRAYLTEFSGIISPKNEKNAQLDFVGLPKTKKMRSWTSLVSQKRKKYAVGLRWSPKNEKKFTVSFRNKKTLEASEGICRRWPPLILKAQINQNFFWHYLECKGNISNAVHFWRSVSNSWRKSHVQREQARSRDPLRESKTAFRLKIA